MDSSWCRAVPPHGILRAAIQGFRDVESADLYDDANTTAARKTLPRSLWRSAQRKLQLLHRQEHPMILPRRPIAIHPGEILREEFLVPLGLSQRDLAAALHVPVQRINLLVNGKRSVTADTAFRLARYFRTSVELWMGLQQDWDVRTARDAGLERELTSIRPLKRSA